MREKEKIEEMKVMAAMHGIKMEGQEADVKNMDKNEINKKAAQRLMMFGGHI